MGVGTLMEPREKPDLKGGFLLLWEHSRWRVLDKILFVNANLILLHARPS